MPSWSSIWTLRPSALSLALASAATSPVTSGTSTVTRRRMRIAVSAGRAAPALAMTSTTFVPGARPTVAWNSPCETAARRPSTVTVAVAGRTVPRSSTPASRTTASSWGAVIWRRTGAGAGPSPPQPPASMHTAAAASGSRRADGIAEPRRSGADALDAPAPRAARRLDLDDVARRGAHERLRHRRLGRQAAGLQVGLRRPDERERLRAAGLLVDDVDGRAELDAVAVDRRLDDLRAAQALGEALDLRLQVRLVLLGGVVIGVLLEVAVLARRRDALRDGLAALALELRELLLQGLEPFRRDGLSCAHRTEGSGARPPAGSGGRGRRVERVLGADVVERRALGGRAAGGVGGGDELRRVEPDAVVGAGEAADRPLHERPAEVVDAPAQRLGRDLEAHLHPARLDVPDRAPEREPEHRGVLEVLLAADLLDAVRAAEQRVERDERQRHELGDAARPLLQRADDAHVLGQLPGLLDVAEHHRRGRAQPGPVARLDDLDPAGDRQLVRRDPLAHAVVEHLGGGARRRVEAGLAQVGEDRVRREPGDVAHVGDLHRAVGVDVEVRGGLLDEPQPEQVVLERPVRVDARLHADLGRAVVDGLEDAALEILAVVLVGVGRALALAEAAERAADDADVRDVDVAVDDERDGLAGELGAQVVGRGAHLLDRLGPGLGEHRGELVGLEPGAGAGLGDRCVHEVRAQRPRRLGP